MKTTIRSLALLVPIALVAVACNGTGSSPTQPALVTPPAATALSAEVTAAMNDALMDEYRAESIYLRVLEDFGQVLPFYNVVVAEVRHSSTLEQVFGNHGLTIPANPYRPAAAPDFDTLPEACAAGVVAERENIEMYDRYLGLSLPTDVRQVFVNNQAASRDNHLPAFERCR